MTDYKVNLDKQREDEVDPLADVPEFFKNPRRIDKIIITVWLFSFFYSIALFPFKVFLLNHPWIAATLSGSISSMVISGAHVKEFGSIWWFPLILGTLSCIKFSAVFWAIGKYWGDEGINLFTANNKRIKKHIKTIEKYSLKYSFIILFLGSLPFVPIPTTIVILLLGNGGQSLKKFMAQFFVIALIMQSIYMRLGYIYGKQVIDFINMVTHYTNYIFIGLIIVIILNSVKNSKKVNKKDDNNNGAVV